MNRILSRLLGRAGAPAGSVGALDPDEHVLAWAALTGGGHLVLTSHGMWFPDGAAIEGAEIEGAEIEGAEIDGAEIEGAEIDGAEIEGAAPRRVGWHLVSKAAWQGGAIVLVEAVEEDVLDGVVILADQRPRRLGLVEPGKVPKVVHERVTGSIRSRHHRDLPGGGAWFVQRKVPGRDGYVLQVRPDEGTDPAVVRQVAGDVGKQLPL